MFQVPRSHEYMYVQVQVYINKYTNTNIIFVFLNNKFPTDKCQILAWQYLVNLRLATGNRQLATNNKWQTHHFCSPLFKFIEQILKKKNENCSRCRILFYCCSSLTLLVAPHPQPFSETGCSNKCCANEISRKSCQTNRFSIFYNEY